MVSGTEIVSSCQEDTSLHGRPACGASLTGDKFAFTFRCPPGKRPGASSSLIELPSAHGCSLIGLAVVLFCLGEFGFDPAVVRVNTWPTLDTDDNLPRLSFLEGPPPTYCAAVSVATPATDEQSTSRREVTTGVGGSGAICTFGTKGELREGARYV